ncbi:tail fiber domain-containing protein [Bacillus toyonensis]|uniref:tail fiber domain-containing protein n=1 Tax=Bacillus toyonensis TaxID=155322 RepID=UPI0015967AF1|nr:tail fiber domain-containing protein [Bacillus toyonensis]
MAVVTQSQITLYEVWDGQQGVKGDKGDKGDQGLQGLTGGTGADGKTYYTWIKYADTPTTGMSDLPAGKVYMGIAYNKLTATESTNYNDYSWSLIKGDKGDTGAQGLQGLQGAKGDQGIQGAKGADGLSSYTHIAYATNSTGTAGFSVSDPVGKTYIGMYVDNIATDSTDPSKYAWSLIKGADGAQGIQGQAGADGKTPYFHTAYANNSTGTSGFSTTDATGRTYIGTYTDYVSADSTDPTKYTWVLIKGDKGDKGDQGVQGIQGVAGTTTYTWVKYATSAAGANMSDLPDGKTYIGLAYNKTTATESTNAADYQWALIKGEKGDTGLTGSAGTNGTDGITYYTWLKYADTPTTGMSDSPTGKTYMGIAYNKTTATESTNYADYSWSLIKGDTGATGAQGVQGIPGAKGADGQTTYTWVKYADDELGNGMHDLPEGKRYLGLAYNKTTATESTNKADYSWSPLYDNVVVGGRNLLLLSGKTFNTTDYLINSYTLSENFNAGEEYTFVIKGTVPAGQKFGIWMNGGSNNVGYATTTYVNGVTFVTFKAVATTSGNERRLNLYNYPQNTTNATVEWVALYKGNVPMDYVQAPEDLNIGGRNWVLGTGTPKSMTGNNTANQTTNIYNFVNNDSTPILNTDIVVSFDWEVTGTTTPTGTLYMQGSNPYPLIADRITFSASNLKGHYSKSTTKIPAGKFASVNMRLDNVTVGAIVTISNFKIATGNVETGWSPAPEDAQSGVDSALSSIADMSSDSLLTALEKRTLKKEWDTIVAEKPTLEAQATTYGITTEKTNFTNAYNTLSTFITPLLSNLAVTSAADGNTLRTNFKNYYSTKALLLKKITDTADTNIDSKANTTVVTPIKDAVEGWTIGQINGKPAMNGDMIQKDTILANRLAVGNFENLFTNGSAEYGNIGWDAHPQWSIVNSTTTAYSGSYHFKGLHGSTSNADFYDSNVIQVLAGEKYYMEGYFKLEKAGTAMNTRTFLVKWLDKAGASTWAVLMGNLTSSWQKLAYEVTVPATAVKMQIGISVNNSLTAGNATYADSLFCKRMLTGELIVDGSIKAAQLDVTDLVAQTAFINAVKATDISGDRIKGGKISGVTYESINATNSKIKVVIEGNTVKSYGASDGTKQNYAELKEGAVSVFQMAESGSPFGDLKASVEPARFNAVQGSRSVALEPSELRFWVPNMTGKIYFDVTSNGSTGYGLRMEAPEGIQINNTLGTSTPAIQFKEAESIYFDGWGNMRGGKYSTSYATFSMQDADGKIKFLAPMGKGNTGATELRGGYGGINFFWQDTNFLNFWGDGTNRIMRFGGDGGMLKWWHGGKYLECKTYNESGFVPIYASSFNTASSLVWKENIKNYEESAIDVINSADIMTYQYKQDQPDVQQAMADGVPIEETEGHTHIGIIAEYAPALVQSESGRGVDSYAMVSLAWKAIQELNAQVTELKAEIALLKQPVEVTE